MLYLSKSKSIIIITRKVYIINNLSVNVFIDIDIIKSKVIIFNLFRDILIINSYDSLKVFISIYNKKVEINIIIFNKIYKVIVSYINIKISI